MRVGEHYKVKRTSVTKDFGIRTFGALNAADDRAWPGEIGIVIERKWTSRDGFANSDLCLEFPRSRRVCISSFDDSDKADYIRVPSLALKEINAQIKAVRSEMKSKGIARSSFMNGGHSPESYRLNAEMFRLETDKQAVQ